MRGRNMKDLLCVGLCLFVSSVVVGATSVEVATEGFPLSIKHDAERTSAGAEELTFSNLWDGDTDATVTIAQDGAAVFEGLTGEGLKTWAVDRNGRYVLTHR